jgi:uncharacterized damage-inducible protein DinB
MEESAMEKVTLDQAWDEVRQRYGVYLRVLDLIPEERLHERLVPGMRTPAELAAHISGTIVRAIALGMTRGEVVADEDDENRIAAELESKEDLLAYARKCWEEADAAIAGVGDAELGAMVETPWGFSFPGEMGIQLMQEELLHHRGQLYVYARLCSMAPPYNWSFEENAPEFRPAAT